MKDLIPLLQPALWVALALYLIKKFRPEVDLLRKVLHQRRESGGAFKIGPLELGALKKEVEGVAKGLGDFNARVSELFLTTMLPAMYFNLEKLAGGHWS